MPSKKRKACPGAAVTPGKRVRIGSSSIVGQDDASVTSASGRPKRSTAGAPSYAQTRRRTSTTVKPEPISKKATTSSQPAKRGPGRPPKIATHIEVPPRKRGRPKKETTAASGASTTHTATARSSNLPRKPAAKTAQELVEDSPGAAIQEADREHDEAEKESEIDDERQYWLMKAEPNSRIEKGQDVKFSIDDLMSKTEPEGWDGVRNPVARNNMRAMREGDLAFFYHSNCSIPGIAGVMQIVREHSIDESAFDPSHPYYDPKSTDRSKPKWELVHVKGVHKFANLVTLKDLKTHMGPGEALENLQTLKQSRLSVSSVSPQQWNFIMDLCGEEFEDEGLEQEEKGTPLDEADTVTTENINGGSKFDDQDGTGAFEFDTDI